MEIEIMKHLICVAVISIASFFSFNTFAQGGFTLGIGHAVGDYELSGFVEGDVSMSTVNLGYVLDNGSAWSLKVGQSTDDLEGGILDLEIDEVTITYSMDDYFIGFQSKETTTNAPNDLILDNYGFFVGTGAANEAGFYYSAAFALLSADIKNQNDDVILEGTISWGASIGLGYGTSLTESLNLNFDYKYQRYNMDWDEDVAGYNDWEELSTFGVSLNYSM
jgi:hypothetical protein